MFRQLILDLLAYGTLFGLLARHRPLRDAFGGLQPARRLFLGALVLAIPAGQIIHRSEWTYPWVAWAMYTERLPGDVTYMEYRLELADGTHLELPVARMFSRIGKKVVWRLRGLERAGSLTACNEILTGMADRYNRDHADNPANAIQIWDCRLAIVAVPGGEPIVQRTLRRRLELAVPS